MGKRFEKLGFPKSFRRDVEKIIFTFAKFVVSLFTFAASKGRVDEGRIDAFATQAVHLIFHECDQGRNHKAQRLGIVRLLPFHQRWNLITERLPHPRWHDDQCVLAIEDVLDDPVLRTAKFAKSKLLFQNLRRQVVGWLGRHHHGEGTLISKRLERAPTCPRCDFAGSIFLRRTNLWQYVRGASQLLRRSFAVALV